MTAETAVGSRWQVVTDLANAADRSESKLPDRKSELAVLRDTLTAKTDQEEKEEKKMLDKDMDDIGEGSARGTVSSLGGGGGRTHSRQKHMMLVHTREGRFRL